MNVSITENCNLDCPYCFAPTGQDLDPGLRMTEEDFQFTINFLKRSNRKLYKMLGGEPTIHPKFKEWISQIVFDPFFESLVIFTNATFDQETKDFLLGLPDWCKKKLRFTINYNGVEVTKDKAELVRMNIVSLAYDENIRIIPGLNLYDPEQNFDHFINLLHNIGDNIEAVRWSVTSPGSPIQDSDSNISSASWEEGRAHYSNMMHKAAEFIYRCKRKGIKYFVTDCTPIFPCFMDEEDVQTILRVAPEILTRQHCNIAIDVEHDLKVGRCFSTAALTNVNLRDFSDHKDIVDYFEHTVDRHRFRVYQDPECKECEARLAGICQGGCMGYQLDLINKRQVNACLSCNEKCRHFGSIPGTQDQAKFGPNNIPSHTKTGSKYRKGGCF